MADCVVAFGSNQGDSRAVYAHAGRRLGQIASGPVIFSDLVQTRPIGGPSEQPEFLNGAFRFQTELDPIQLHEELVRIETELGRERRERWGERKIDLDLLLVDELIMNDAMLTIPHPRMSFRRFVLQPANEIAAEMVHPTSGLTISELWERINRDKKELLWITSRPKFAAEMVQELEEMFAEWKIYLVESFEETLPESPTLMVCDDSRFHPFWKGPSLDVSSCSPKEIKTEIFAALAAVGQSLRD